MQKVITITIDGLTEPVSNNPFIAIGNEIKRKAELKESVREANFKIRNEFEKQISELQDYLHDKISAAGIPVGRSNTIYRDHGYDYANQQLVKNLYFNNGEQIIFKIHAELMDVEGHKMYTGAYKTYYAYASVRDFDNYRSSINWTEFAKTEELEQAIVKLLTD